MTTLLQLVRGGALAGVCSGVVLALALVSSLAPGANRLLFLAVAIAALVYSLIDVVDDSWAAPVGSLAVVAVGLTAAILTGWGWLEGSLTAGGVIGFFWLRQGSPGVVPTIPTWMAAVGVVVVLAALMPLVVDGGTLGHDESAYALKALSWLDGSPDTGWTIHRAPALSAYAYVVFGLGGDEPWLRLTGLVALGGLAAATWWLGARMFGRWVGALAALVVVAGPAMLRRATEFLTDIPAAALLVAAMAVIWNQFERRSDGPGYGLLWVLPLTWAAFYLRYQSVLAFGLIGLAVTFLWWRQIRYRPGPVLALAGLGLVGLMPHALQAWTETGSPIGILTFTAEVSGRDYFGEGLVDYAIGLAWPLAGLLGLPMVVFFLWWLVAGWREPAGRRAGLFLAIPAIGQVLLLGLLSHGESRFVFFPLALVAVGAVVGAIEITSQWRPRPRNGTRLALTLLLGGSIALSVAATRGSVENRILDNEPVELASEFVESESASTECGVLTSYLPQVTFYSGCSTRGFGGADSAEQAIELLPGDVRFMILVEDGKRQPTGHRLDDLIAETTGREVVVEGDRDQASVFEFDPGP